MIADTKAAAPRLKCARCGWEWDGGGWLPLSVVVLCDVCDLRDEADQIERSRGTAPEGSP